MGFENDVLASEGAHCPPRRPPRSVSCAVCMCSRYVVRPAKSPSACSDTTSTRVHTPLRVRLAKRPNPSPPTSSHRAWATNEVNPRKPRTNISATCGCNCRSRKVQQNIKDTKSVHSRRWHKKTPSICPGFSGARSKRTFSFVEAVNRFSTKTALKVPPERHLSKRDRVIHRNQNAFWWISVGTLVSTVSELRWLHSI